MANEMVKEGGVWRFRSQPKSYEEASYDLLPNGVENGSEAITKNNNARWVYCAVAGCWIPEQFYDSGLAIQQDRSATPKDLDFRTPQVSDFSGLSDYDNINKGTGTTADGTDEIIMTAQTGSGNANRQGIVFTREVHSGDSLLIVDQDYQPGAAYGDYISGINIQNNTRNSSPSKTILIYPAGSDTNTANQILFAETSNALGDPGRPTGGITASAGSRIFIKFNGDELVTGTATDKFVTIINQDQDSRFTTRATYNDLGLRTDWTLYGGFSLFVQVGTYKIKRFQLLKYT